jgi:nucleoside-diphosphate-sugar epimerase
MARPVRVIVTGAGGFIGGHLARSLRERGHDVWGMDRIFGTPTTSMNSMRLFVERYSPDVIAHLGANCSTAVSLRDPSVDFRDNVQGTFNVCEASREAGGIPILFTSTCKVNPGADGKIAPLGASKRVAEEYLNLYQDTYGIPAINRPSTVYGPGQDGNSDAGWFTWFINAALTDQTIKLAGDGNQSRDVLYVKDFVELLIDQVENFDLYRGGTYNVGGGRANEVSLNQLLEVLEYENVEHVPRLPADIDRVVTDNTKVSEVNGWHPTTDWISGMMATRGWLWSTSGQ